MMNILQFLLLLLIPIFSIDSHPLSTYNLSPSQIDHLCSLMSSSSNKDKRFAIPFPDMNRFLSTSHKIHHDQKESTTKHDFHAYLCSISKDSEEMSSFINIFIEEHGEPPAFNLFESCEQVAKRDESAVQFDQLSEVCSARIAKRWKGSVAGPMSIDFINQMLEARKVQPYPYSVEMDPYLVKIKTAALDTNLAKIDRCCIVLLLSFHGEFK